MTDPEACPLEVRSYFVRGRNALLARAEFEPLYIDYYLHRAAQDLKYTNEHDLMLKEALAALTLHLASRPQDETSGWTLNFDNPLLNIFVTGGSRPGRVTGRVFTEDVRDFGKNIFIAQTASQGKAARQSMVDFTGRDVFSAVEDFYTRSEQRMTRLFRHGEEDIVMVSAQPDCDEEWLAALTPESIMEVDKTETLSLLETRLYIWHCGCNAERLFPVLAKLGDEDLSHAFGEDEVITMTCPRCGARYRTSKEQFEAWKVEKSEKA